MVLQYRSVWIGYRNTIFYTTFGTLINVTMTLICAYPLSRKGLAGRGFFTFLFTFTMIFSGGMIPAYILMRDLRLLNTIWAMVLPGAISVYNMIVTRTFFQNTIPIDLLEASKLDGCSDFQYFFRVLLPLSKSIIAVISLFYAVGHWNAFFNAFLYLSNQNLFPLQLFLRQILVQNQFSSDMIMDSDMALQLMGLQDTLKFAVIVVSTVPLMCFYPIAQKHFVKGVMIGSLKG
jgi:multiple sugar transport system permease protein/putative aldouronate transport system permease protein